jgi:iron(III) transport system ATP-binding protein
MRFEIKKLQKEFGFTIIFVTHDQSEAMAISERMLVMDMCRQVQIGTPTELYNKPNSRFVHKFLGQSTFTNCVIENGKAYAKGNLQQLLPVDPPKGCDHEMILATRPNQIDINKESGYESVVENRIFLTDYTEYQVKVGDTLVQVQTPHRVEFSVGEKCFLRFPNAMWYPMEDEAAEAERNRRQLV